MNRIFRIFSPCLLLFLITSLTLNAQQGFNSSGQRQVGADQPDGDPIYLSAPVQVETVQSGRQALEGYHAPVRTFSHKTQASLTNLDGGDAVEGDYIRDLKFFAKGERLISANFVTQNVSIMDWNTGNTIADIPVGGGPQDIAIMEPYAVVSLSLQDTTVVIDLTTNTVVAQLSTPGQPNKIRIDKLAGIAYVAASDSNRLYKIDLNTLTVSGFLEGFFSASQTFSLITSNNRSDFEYRDFAISPDGQYGVSYDTSFSGIAVHDLASGMIDTVIRGIRYYHTMEASDTSRIILVSTGSPTVLYQLDLSTFRVDSIVSASALTSICRNIAVNPAGDRVVLSVSGGIALADFNTGTVTNIAPDIAFWIDRSGNGRYAVCGGFNTRVVDLQTGSVFGPLTGLTQSMGAASDSLLRFAGMDPLRREYGHRFDYTTLAFVNKVGEFQPGSVREGDAPYRAAILDFGRKALVAHQLNHSGAIYDLNQMKLDTIVQGLEETAFACGGETQGSTGILADYDDGKLHIFDCNTGMNLKTITVGDRPARAKVYTGAWDTLAATLNVRSNTLSLIRLDGSNSTLLGNVPVGVVGVSWTNQGIFSDFEFVGPGSGLILVAASFDDEVKVVDFHTRTVLQSITVGDFPTEIAVNSLGTFAAVLNKNDGTLSLLEINGNTVSLKTTVSCGNNPTRISYDETGQRFVVCSGGDQAVYFFNESTGAQTGSVNFAPDYTPIFAEILPLSQEIAYLLTTSNTNLSNELRVGTQAYALPARPCHMDVAKWSSVDEVVITMAGPDYVSVYKGDTILHLPSSGGPVTEKLEVGPNPFAGRFIVNIGPEMLGGTMQLVDMQGRTVYQTILSETGWQEVSPGVAIGQYILKVRNQDRVWRKTLQKTAGQR